MLFSIIIPTYNRALILKETLTTVLKQTFTDFEVIVVDDGSSDNTADIVKELKSDKLHYFYKNNEERSIARNYGADKAKGDYLIFLDSDDEMLENHLYIINQFLIKNEFVPQFIFSGYVILNPDKSLLYEYGISGIFKEQKLFYGNFLGCSSVIIQSNLFKKYYFNTEKDLILFEDWELWLRVIADTTLYCLPSKSIIMTNHTGRSVLNYKAEQFNSKILHFKNHILKISSNLNATFVNRQTFLMGIYSYAALHIAMTKENRLVAIKYFLLAFICNPLLITKKRFFGTLRQLW
jgi:glycosyltransferase involved in cell wall biosynthesis